MTREIRLAKLRAHRNLKRCYWKIYSTRIVYDPDRRNCFLARCIENTHIQKIICSDEVTFKLNGAFKRHECIFWGPEYLYFGGTIC